MSPAKLVIFDEDDIRNNVTEQNEQKSRLIKKSRLMQSAPLISTVQNACESSGTGTNYFLGHRERSELHFPFQLFILNLNSNMHLYLSILIRPKC